MALKIIRTPDTITLSDTDVRSALAEYVEHNSGRHIDRVMGDGIAYHPSQSNTVGNDKRFNCLYVTVTLKDDGPVGDEKPRSAKGDTSDTIFDVKALINRLSAGNYAGHESVSVNNTLTTLRHVVTLLGRLRRLEDAGDELA